MSSSTLQQVHATYSSTEARTKWRTIMDSSSRGVTVTIRRDNDVSAVTDAERLRQYFAKTCAPGAVSYVENGVHVIVLEGRGFISEGATLSDAVDDMVVQLREYQEDWDAQYSSAPNHQKNWPISMLAATSTDEQLKEWLLGGE